MAHGKLSVMPLSCMSMVVEELEAWRTHDLVMAMRETGLRVVSYTQNQFCLMEKRGERTEIGKEKREEKKERKGEKERKEKEKIERKERKGRKGSCARLMFLKKWGAGLCSNRLVLSYHG